MQAERISLDLPHRHMKRNLFIFFIFLSLLCLSLHYHVTCKTTCISLSALTCTAESDDAATESVAKHPKTPPLTTLSVNRKISQLVRSEQMDLKIIHDVRTVDLIALSTLKKSILEHLKITASLLEPSSCRVLEERVLALKVKAQGNNDFGSKQVTLTLSMRCDLCIYFAN